MYTTGTGALSLRASNFFAIVLLMLATQTALSGQPLPPMVEYVETTEQYMLRINKLLRADSLMVLDRHTPSIRYTNPEIARHVYQLEEESPTARELLSVIRSSGVDLIMGPPQELGMLPATGGRLLYSATYSSPVQGGDLYAHPPFSISISLEDFREVYQELHMAFPAISWHGLFEGEVLATIGHELAHLSTLIDAEFRVSEACHDPQNIRNWLGSCIERIENQIRREIGVPLDMEYGFTNEDIERYMRINNNR